MKINFWGILMVDDPTKFEADIREVCELHGAEIILEDVSDATFILTVDPDMEDHK